ncbi:MAG: Mfa1 family fimbria major subunit [Clostridium sp.]|nr:Mfa1 family fimbria major subunit [Clostridium sp.]
MIKKIITSMFVALTFWACSSGDEPAGSGGETATGQYIKLRLTLPTAESRAESHENEDALENECRIENINIFIYKEEAGTGKGLNTSGDSLIKEGHYVVAPGESTANFIYYGATTIEAKVYTRAYKAEEGDRIAVLVNMGNLTGAIHTLGDLHECQAAAYRKGAMPGDYAGFAMANAYSTDGELEAVEGDTPTDTEIGDESVTLVENLRASLSVERLAARIDLDYSNLSLGEAYKDGLLAYTARLAETGDRVGTVYVSHILPVNAMQEASYALKRVSEGDGEDYLTAFRYTGTLDKAGGIPTQYALEPRTGLKGAPQAAWYGATAASSILAAGEGNFKAENALRQYLDASTNLKGKEAAILAYSNENTQHESVHDANCLTGLVIRAQYAPDMVFGSADLKTKRPGERGMTIYRYAPRSISSTEADAIYFDNREAAQAYCEANPGDLADITEYKEGVCYYNMWIRHTVVSDGQRPAGKITFPMEYGIVRNHIYRVALNFRGIGYDDVTLERPWNVEPEVFVRPWNVRQQPEIIM